MVINDGIVEELLINVLARWCDDLLECSKTLEYKRKGRYKNREHFKLCTGVYIHNENDIENLITKVCFSNMDNITEYLFCICNNPSLVFDLVWNECIKICPYWGLYFNVQYKYISGVLNGKSRTDNKIKY